MGLLLIFGLAAGWWIKSKRLNETEQKLAGVWELRDDRTTYSEGAFLLLEDGSVEYATDYGTRWKAKRVTWSTWEATSEEFVFREPRKALAYSSPRTWWNDIRRILLRSEDDRFRISTFREDVLILQSVGSTYQLKLRRSSNSDLSGLFEQRNAMSRRQRSRTVE